MSGLVHHHHHQRHLDPDSSSQPDFVEVDPTGRYGRYDEVLGKGSSKTVFRAFDEYDGIEVAWNQVKPNDFLRSSHDLERLYCEIHLLKTLKHKNIMKMYASWVDTSTRNINFITEMFTSGTLRQYMLRHRKVNIRAVKHWCRQILKGLHYLHSHDPPVIHRDLKCDNIFINGNHGEVKIGDLGLAAFLRESHAEHCVGTPEFMAPEVYNEEYNELVDIYSFGMCVLEMVTLEFPYSECTTPAQIYKKVISGKKPDAFYKIEDPEVRDFVEKCLATASHRLSARELLEDPFLQIVEYQSNSVLVDCEFPSHPLCDNHFTVGHSGVSKNHAGVISEGENMELRPNGIELFEHEGDEDMHRVDVSIKGHRSEDGGIYLRLRIVEEQGRTRNIYFSFDLEKDTALSVATEMVSELDLSGHDEIHIAQMIDGEIAALIPEWRSGSNIEDNSSFASVGDTLNCISNYTSDGYLRSHNRNLSTCTVATHGRFEEIYCDHENGSVQEVMDDAPSVEFSSSDPRENHSDDENENLNPSNLMVNARGIGMVNTTALKTMVNFESSKPSLSTTQKDDGERIYGMFLKSCFQDNETYKVEEQLRERRSFPKIGSLKIQGYEQPGFFGKTISTSISFSSLSCLPRTSSARVDDSDAWCLYCNFLHTSF